MKMWPSRSRVSLEVRSPSCQVTTVTLRHSHISLHPHLLISLTKSRAPVYFGHPHRLPYGGLCSGLYIRLVQQDGVKQYLGV